LISHATASIAKFISQQTGVEQVAMILVGCAEIEVWLIGIDFRYKVVEYYCQSV
jgi:hypothetical protein